MLKNQQKQIKREVKWKLIEAVDRSELVLIKFSEEDKRTQLNWKHSKEFEYKGEMYDIAETEVHGDTTFYWCWWDHEETALNKQLNRLFSFALGNSPTHKQSQEKLIQIFKSLYFFRNDICVDLICSELSNCLIDTYRMNYLNHFISLNSPPPKLS